VVVELASWLSGAPHGGESSISVSWYEAQNAAYVNRMGRMVVFVDQLEEPAAVGGRPVAGARSVVTLHAPWQ
jgi:hypothetical protein